MLDKHHLQEIADYWLTIYIALNMRLEILLVSA
jgi:hypothetical protein